MQRDKVATIGRQEELYMLVIMLATLESRKFVSYFTGVVDGCIPASCHVRGKCFPVEMFFLEDVLDAFGHNLELCRRIKLRIHEMFDKPKKPWFVHPQHADKFYDITISKQSHSTEANKNTPSTTRLWHRSKQRVATLCQKQTASPPPVKINNKIQARW